MDTKSIEITDVPPYWKCFKFSYFCKFYYLIFVVLKTNLVRDKSWTSGYRHVPGTKFLWGSANNAEFNFTRWANGEPLGPKVGCVYIRGSDSGITWDVGDCQEVNYVICERRL